MNSRVLFLSTFCSAFLIASTTAMSQNSTNISISQNNNGGGSQSIGIDIESENLGQPYILSISAPQDTQITGQITRNDQVIHVLSGNQVSINLSPLLSEGSQIFKISGDYKPTDSSIQIEVSGSSTRVSQQASGNGKLDQALVIEVE